MGRRRGYRLRSSSCSSGNPEDGRCRANNAPMKEYLKFVALPDVQPHPGRDKEYSFENFREAFNEALEGSCDAMYERLKNQSALHDNKTRYHDKRWKDEFLAQRYDSRDDTKKAEESSRAVSDLQQQKAARNGAAKLRCFNCNDIRHKARECEKAQREGNHSGQAMSLSTRIQCIAYGIDINAEVRELPMQKANRIVGASRRPMRSMTMAELTIIDKSDGQKTRMGKHVTQTRDGMIVIGTNASPALGYVVCKESQEARETGVTASRAKDTASEPEQGS
ncbi:hypothetical protein Y032_0016g2895 [Ancylostoma ceylanicum]|uniref:CCHC-type domain-containing protein n=1 Tax=Ancylostoma ceylanicum TaxID=53326 RepID=A0A016V5G2_9BILA|nr:hypothetical protein Y032_0016g2895 [Ancylostoma ceylanicum]